MTWAVAILLAAWLDRRFGEPANAWHPVAWLGWIIGPLGRPLPAWRPAAAFVAGALLWVVVIAVVAWLAWQLQLALLGLPPWLAAPLLAVALKPGFSWRMLDTEVGAVDAALVDGGIDAGRARLARLCSRDVTTLDARAVRETAVESLAENLNDSLVAALFWAVIAGLPGAWVWRAVNTMDAMWGYRDHRQWAGKWAARADDVLGWLPARVTAVLLWRPGLDWTLLAREAASTPSPNGGWPMAAMALRLGVRLAKPGVYCLNAAGASVGPTTIDEARVVARSAAHRAFGLAMLTLVVIALLASRP